MSSSEDPAAPVHQPDPHEDTTPEQTFDPLFLLRSLVNRNIKFIVIGGVAARAHGSPTVTVDLDICYDRTPRNLEALAAALQDLHASLRGTDANLPFRVERRTFELGDHFTLSTDAGPLDCLATPAGTKGFPDLEARAVTLDIDRMPVKFAHLEDLIRMKRAAGRPKDRIEMEVLEALRQEVGEEGPSH